MRPTADRTRCAACRRRPQVSKQYQILALVRGEQRLQSHTARRRPARRDMEHSEQQPSLETPSASNPNEWAYQVSGRGQTQLSAWGCRTSLALKTVASCQDGAPRAAPAALGSAQVSRSGQTLEQSERLAEQERRR